MLAYRFNSTLFTHVIAANSIIEAVRQSAILLESRTVQGPTPLVVPWHGTDAWTRRAIESAMSPGVIDTIPRFVVDRKDGPVYLDIDDIITELGIGPERTKCINDSEAHDAWYAACLAESLRGDALRSYIRNLVEIDDSGTYPFHARALAGAWGLGPIPEWHAAILPALIALDIEMTQWANGTPVTWFEADSNELTNHLSTIRDDDVAGDFKSCGRHIAHSLNCFRPVGITCSDRVLRRAWAQSALSIIGWLPRANLRNFIASIDKATA